MCWSRTTLVCASISVLLALSDRIAEAGGTHLPDITVVTPVFDDKGKEIIFYTASCGHHRDIGGLGGISGNPNATYLEQEGALVKSFKLASGGHFDEEGRRLKPLINPCPYSRP
jgi:N-methylhydantoinase B/oxoprolinase/acetone carboxylase alpha subunit